MALYRVKQFAWGFTSLFKDIDYKYIEMFLNEQEIKVFNNLKHNDKHHCIRVCKDSINMIEDLNLDIDKKKVGRAALLHDIGKVKAHLSLIEKSTIVILDKLTKGKIKKYNNIKQIEVYYNHPKIGFDILINNGFRNDIELLEVVRFHHSNNLKRNNEILNIIKICDSRN